MISNRHLAQYAFFASLLLFNTPTEALSLDLGIAGEFNAFVLGDMTANHSDVEGRLAVGGDLSLDHYAVGMLLNNSYGTRDDLVVGGELDFSNGRIYNGNARSGGVASIAESVGFYSEDDIDRRNGSYIPGNPIDFKQIGHDLIDKSNTWATLNTNGSTDLNEWGGLRLSGLSQTLNIFSLSADQLMKTSLFWLDTPEDSWNLINVTGNEVSMNGFGFYRTVNGEQQRILDNAPPFRHDGSLTQKILFNLVDADFLDIHSIGIKGSILAPLANTVFYNSHIDGNVMVASLQGKSGEYSGQVNYYPFLAPSESPTAEVPEPPLLTLFVPLMLGLWYRAYDRSRRNDRDA